MNKVSVSGDKLFIVLEHGWLWVTEKYMKAQLRGDDYTYFGLGMDSKFRGDHRRFPRWTEFGSESESDLWSQVYSPRGEALSLEHHVVNAKGLSTVIFSLLPLFSEGPLVADHTGQLISSRSPLCRWVMICEDRALPQSLLNSSRCPWICTSL